MKENFGIGWVLALVAFLVVGCAGAPRLASPVGLPLQSPQAPVLANNAKPGVPGSPDVSAENAKTLPSAGIDGVPKARLPKTEGIDGEASALRCELPTDPDQALGLYGKDAWPRGHVVLTFDDGPHPTITPRVLDLLDRHDMHATFFLVGRAINRKTFHIVQRMVGAGHTLGVHSYNHDIEMSTRVAGERTVAYIHGQHAVTQILIDLALLASSGDDFDQLYRRVFEEDPLVYLPSSSLRTKLSAYVARHEALLRDYGLRSGERVHPVLFSRPPGGAPYLGESPAWSKDAYDEAMARLGTLNVMWHGGAGDTDPQKRGDFSFLLGNIRHHAKRGGVLLIHDYIRKDALAAALQLIADDPDLHVVPIEQAVEQKFGCAAWAMRERLQHPQRTPQVARVTGTPAR
jgi:peptidoglycan/xylan/chitin deacetylase (PgdA/CDA1 family)